MVKSSFHLGTYNNCTLKVYILSRHTSVATNLTKVVLFKKGLTDVWSKKYSFFFTLDYLSSGKAKISKFATLSWHSQKEQQNIKNDPISNLS